MLGARDPELAARVCAAFDLGEGVLSVDPVALGRVGAVWRLEASTGVWAVKTNENDDQEPGASATAAFQEAAVRAGVPAPAVRRTISGDVLAPLGGGLTVRVLAWVDLVAADIGLDPVAVGELLAGLHRVPDGPWATGMPAEVDPWFVTPVGPAAWDEQVSALRRAGAPFAEDLAAHRDELVALEAGVRPPRTLRVCHRDLFADNLRARPAGGLCVFDFDNAGPLDPDYELAHVVAEFATDARGAADSGRARTLVDAYAAAGGPARLRGPESFTTVVAVLGHIGHLAGQRWLATSDEAVRADMAGWATELFDRPLTRAVVADLLDAAG